MARNERVAEKKMRAAAIIGQFVKDQPAGHMKTKADALLGTHLQAAHNPVDCPLESQAPKSAEEAAESAAETACGCS
jgi:hypothetical protein